jgi:hypothetical protein
MQRDAGYIPVRELNTRRRRGKIAAETAAGNNTPERLVSRFPLLLRDDRRLAERSKASAARFKKQPSITAI